MKLLEIDFAKKKRKAVPMAVVMPFHEIQTQPKSLVKKKKRKDDHLTLSI